ncbi:MAG: glycosyltransferase [Cyanobacteria bacterium J06642_2]
MFAESEASSIETPIETLSERRRFKASLVLLTVWLLVVALHVFPVARWAVVGLAAVMAVYAVRFIAMLPVVPPTTLPASSGTPAAPNSTTTAEVPLISLLVPAKNEGAVLPALLQTLSQLDYPAERFEVWVIDDASTDHTAECVAAWQTRFPQLHVYRREAGASGGKSGALNEVLPLTQGDIIGVFDADAAVPVDLLQRSLPLFESEAVMAVQVRKAIANRDVNIWTWGQSIEMALDSYFQQQRVAVGGLSELRGNGQLVRRSALEKVGGWNEATVTDDLDLTLRLHLLGGDIAFLVTPPVLEEGVTDGVSLWHQRNRWAEGGYQRYLDYWPSILNNHLGTAKTLDLTLFLFIQYLLPIAIVPDFLLTAFRTHQPALWPLSLVFAVMTLVALSMGSRRALGLRGTSLGLAIVGGSIYMLHWIPVMVATTARMCVRPKRLKWVKTLHEGGYYDLADDVEVAEV